MGVIYTGVFFDFSDMEKWELLGEAMGFKSRPHLTKTYLHHVTLEFRPDPDGEHLRKVLEHEGEVVDVKIVGVTSHWRPHTEGCVPILNPVVAFEVELGETLKALRIECANTTPHLTVATSDSVGPVAANYEQYNAYDGPILTGRLGVFRVENNAPKGEGESE